MTKKLLYTTPEELNSIVIERAELDGAENENESPIVRKEQNN